MSWEEFFGKRKELYIDKVEKRIEEWKAHPGFGQIEQLIADGTAYSGIDEILSEYETLYDRMIGKKEEELSLCVSHGDLCFSNILYQSDADMVRLIDPKGALDKEALYTDPYYDMAKLSHSICGNYDFINSALYEIVVGDDMSLKLVIDNENEPYANIFKEFLGKAGFDIRFVRLFECSLFLSMLPLHQDRPNKVLAFILNAIDILDEVRNG